MKDIAVFAWLLGDVMEPSSGGIGDLKSSGPDRGTKDRGTGRIESGGEIN